jgi:hypothetical protein
MKYAVEMGSGAMIHISRFIKIASISFHFFKIWKVALKMQEGIVL